MKYPRSSAVQGSDDGSAVAVEMNRMRVSPRTPMDEARLTAVAIADFSHLARLGVKGPGAGAWLESHGVALPEVPNSWRDLPGDGVIARLGRSEYFLEDGPSGDTVPRMQAAPGLGTEGIYPVSRQDAALALLGPRSNELLVQACNVNFEAIGRQEAVMTQMLGVSVLVIRRDVGQQQCHRLWCDPTFAPYLWNTLSGIAAELGGGAVGTDGLLA
jgi:sarcosine oxidase, subunit gamma